MDGGGSGPDWITVENGEAVPVEPGQDKKKAIKKHFEKMTPAEKIASVHIDPTKDSVLPELNESDLAKMGISKNKKVVVKATTSDRNEIRHPDVSIEDRDKLIGETLYSPTEIFKGNKDKPYYTFIKPLRLSPRDGKTIDNGLVLLDIDETKESFEVVHWHWIREKDLEKLKAK